MKHEELIIAIDELRASRNSIDQAIDSLQSMLNSVGDAKLRLAEAEGWCEMDEYLNRRSLELRLSQLEGWSALEQYMGGRQK